MDVAVTALSNLSCECYARETPTNIPEEEATHTCGCRGRQKLRSTGNSGLTEGGGGEKCVYAKVRKTTETGWRGHSTAGASSCGLTGLSVLSIFRHLLLTLYRHSALNNKH